MPWSPSPDAVAVPGRLRCYACGNEYDYLGAGTHPGGCPACGARDVSPAGDLAVLARPTPVVSGPGDSTHRIDAADDTDRTFTYWIDAIDDDRAQLVRIGIDEVLVGPTHPAWPGNLDDLVPWWLGRAVRAADMELVAPAAILE